MDDARNGPHKSAQSHPNGNGSTGALHTVADVAALLNLKPQQVSGKLEYHGANPDGGATKDGFFIRENGTGYDRNGTFYTCKKVAEMAGIAPDSYEPFAQWKAGNAPQRPQNRAQTNGTAPKPKTDKGAPTETATYTYPDENGETLFRVQRKKFADGSKTFPTSRPDGRGGWIFNLEGARRVLYRLPDVLAASWVFLCEGEKAADALNAALQTSGDFGPYIATTNPHGAGKWRGEFNATLSGKTVCVLPDFDESGDKHAGEVLASLAGESESERADFLCRVDLPDLPGKGDVADWLDTGGTVETLIQLVENATAWQPAPEPKKPSRLVKIGDLRKRPAPKWLIQRFLVLGATSLFTADSGSYKSFIALHIAYSVAHGLPFFGRGIQSGPVVYVAGEGGDGIRARSIAWDKHHEREAPENLFVWESAVQVGKAEEVTAFLLELEEAELKPALIIFDTLNRCAEGLEENSAKDMGLFCAGLERIKRATGAHVSVVHHNNANGKSRGSTALPGAFDTRFSAEREGVTVTLRCQKQKDGAAEFDPFSLDARVIEIGETDEFGDPITSLVLEPSEKVPTSEKSDFGREKSGAKERTGAAILAELAALHSKASDGAKVSKTDWQEAVIKAGVCSRSVFYLRVKELETANRWHWWKGDCRLEEIGEKSEKSDTSEKSDFGRIGLDGNTLKSEKSEKSDFPLGNRTNRTNRTNPAPEAKKNGKKPKSSKRPKTKSATAEPYGVANASSEAATENAARDFAANFGDEIETEEVRI